MRIMVKVVPRAKQNSIIKEGELFIIRTTTVPVDGKANAMVQKILAQYFHVSKSCVTIVRGSKSRMKQVDILL